MTNRLSRYNSSLALKLTIPVILLSLLFFIGIFVVLKQKNNTSLENDVNHRLNLIVRSIVIGTEVNANNKNLFRMANSMAAEHQIQNITITDIKEKLIIASSNNELIGKPITNLDAINRSLLRNINSLKFNRSDIYQHGDLFNYVYKVKLLSIDQKRFRDIAILIEYFPEYDLYWRNESLLVTIYGFALMLSIYVLILLLLHKKHVLKPLQKMMQSFDKESGDNKFSPIEVNTNDEFGLLIKKYNETATGRHDAITKFERALNDLKQAHRSKATFFSRLSHELRTPLNSIVGFSHRLLFEESQNDKQKYAIKSINENGIALLTMVNDLLMLSDINSENFDFNNAKLDIKEVTEHCIAQIKKQADGKSITANLTVLDGNYRIKGDLNKIKYSLSKLISHTLQQSKNSSIQITLATETHHEIPGITLCLKPDNYTIDDEQEPISFDQFEYNHQNTETGIGFELVLANEYVKMHHGTITILNNNDSEYHYTIFIPYQLTAL